MPERIITKKQYKKVTEWIDLATDGAFSQWNRSYDSGVTEITTLEILDEPLMIAVDSPRFMGARIELLCSFRHAEQL